MPPSSRSYDRNPNSNQRGGGRHHLPFERPPAPGGFQPTMGMGGFQSGHVPGPHHAGHKRGRPLSPDGNDGGSFAKLFVGSVPKTATEEDVRPLFEEHGDVIEVALLKDKRTGQQQGPFEGLKEAHVSAQLGFATVSGLCLLVANLLFLSVL